MSGRIATLVRVRRLLERRALGDLAAGERRLREAQAARQARRAAYLARPAAPPALSPTQLLAIELQGLGAHALVVESDDAAEQAQAERDARHRAWALAAVKLGSVERLAERRHAEATAAADAARARALDELAVLRRRARR